MLAVADALTQILAATKPLAPAVFPLASDNLGLVLATAVTADLDSPPFAKALMDGYAVRVADLGAEPLVVGQEIPAGRVPTAPLAPGQAARIFTGAIVPDGADAVIPQEDAERIGDTVRFRHIAWPVGLHILPRGREMHAGESIIPAGTVLRPQEFGVLAAVGKVAYSAYPRPRLAIVSTGDELIEPAWRPRPGQIRNSNAPMLIAQAARAGALPRFLGIAGDKPGWLASVLGEGLATAQVLVVTGGVSVGDFDLVPAALEQLGVTIHLHKVHLKPGKPLLFGTKGDTLVFGLPGNPVSAFVGFELFVRPAVRKLAGQRFPETVPLPLSEPLTHDSNRPTYHPARIDRSAAHLTVRPVPWFGSADLRALLQADALLEIPAGSHSFPAGHVLSVVALDS